MTNELKKKAERLFKKTAHHTFYVTPRGGFFTSKSLCKNALKEGEEMEVVKRKAVAEVSKQEATGSTDDNKTMTAKEVIAAIQEADNPDDLEKYVDDERKTVQDALENQLASFAKEPEPKND